jgi:hypothetical protein
MANDLLLFAKANLSGCGRPPTASIVLGRCPPVTRDCRGISCAVHPKRRLLR